MLKTPNSGTETEVRLQILTRLSCVHCLRTWERKEPASSKLHADRHTRLLCNNITFFYAVESHHLLIMNRVPHLFNLLSCPLPSLSLRLSLFFTWGRNRN